MGIKPIDRLLFAQGGACFFCSAQLPRAEATVEHLVAQAHGGSNADHNCVACCRDMNMLLGSLSLKEKLRIVLNQKGKFVCPKRTASATAPPTAAAPPPAAAVAKPKPKAPPSCSEVTSGPNSGLNCDLPVAIISNATPKPPSSKKKASRGPNPPYCAIVLKDLRKRGASRPKRLEALRITIQSVVAAAKGTINDSQLDSLLQHLQASGKVQISGTTVNYSL